MTFPGKGEKGDGETVIGGRREGEGRGGRGEGEGERGKGRE
jgi:hypothetical protein